MKTQFKMIEWIEKAGFVTNPLTTLCDSVDEVLKFNARSKPSAKLGYDIDGVVTRSTGLTGRSGLVLCLAVRAIAHKFRPSRRRRFSTISKLVGRTGADAGSETRASDVGGVVVQNATLHNEDYIKGIGNDGTDPRGR